MTPESIVENVKNPAMFQVELSDYINALLHNRGKVIEVGCESGVTSFLLNCDEKCFFDLNEDIIHKVEKAHRIIMDDVCRDSFVVGDMFDMPFKEESFDIAFNAGVLEHFSSAEIEEALREMARVTKRKGYVIVAIPNHYCYVYRSAYLYGQFLDGLRIRRWEWPKENKYFDLSEEGKKAGLKLEKRIVMSKDSIWKWWGGRRYILVRMLLRFVNSIIPCEGYLTTLVFTKE